MPCMGPSGARSEKLAIDLVDKLWLELEWAYHHNSTIFSLVDDVENILKKLLRIDNIRDGYDFNRYKYLTLGVLNTMFPNETYEIPYVGGIATGSRLNHTRFEQTTKEMLAKHLGDTFFILDCEDF